MFLVFSVLQVLECHTDAEVHIIIMFTTQVLVFMVFVLCRCQSVHGVCIMQVSECSRCLYHAGVRMFMVFVSCRCWSVQGV